MGEIDGKTQLGNEVLALHRAERRLPWWAFFARKWLRREAMRIYEAMMSPDALLGTGDKDRIDEAFKRRRAEVALSVRRTMPGRD